MTDSAEREADCVSRRALDDALVSLGRRRVAENPDFRPAVPVYGNSSTLVLEAAGVAPFRFLFGSDLDIWVGPFSEVVTARVSGETEAEVRSMFRDLLLSAVTSRKRRWSTEITLQLPDAEPWVRLRVVARISVAPLEPAYRPYVER